MTIITDALVEKAAESVFERTGDKWSEASPSMRKVWLGDIRAALEGALPDIVDAIGKFTPEIKSLRSRIAGLKEALTMGAVTINCDECARAFDTAMAARIAELEKP